MSIPTIAIVGRPNVGKSALFNRLLKKRVAIVEETSGVTRDRNIALCDFENKKVRLIDTGGILDTSKQLFKEDILLQTKTAINEADLLVLVVDGIIGPTTEDERVAKLLHESKKNVLLVVNKIDSHTKEDQIYPFYSLGFSNILPLSALQGLNIDLFTQKSLSLLPKKTKIKEEDKSLRIAIIGQCNVGKSSLINALLKEERLIVSKVAGTTVDSIDVKVVFEKESYLFVDTAGIRKKFKEKSQVDKFASIRTKEAIERSDLVLFILDAQKPMGREEKSIFQTIYDQKKGCLILVNKWDLIEGVRQEHLFQFLKTTLPPLAYFPILCISAKYKKNLQKIFPMIQKILNEYKKRISTSKLNRFIEDSIQNYHPPMIQGKRLRIYYMTQVSTSPPRFLLFINHKNLFDEGYKKYLLKRFRETFGFFGIPIHFNLKEKTRKEEP